MAVDYQFMSSYDQMQYANRLAKKANYLLFEYITYFPMAKLSEKDAFKIIENAAIMFENTANIELKKCNDEKQIQRLNFIISMKDEYDTSCRYPKFNLKPEEKELIEFTLNEFEWFKCAKELIEKAENEVKRFKSAIHQ